MEASVLWQLAQQRTGFEKEGVGGSEVEDLDDIVMFRQTQTSTTWRREQKCYAGLMLEVWQYETMCTRVLKDLNTHFWNEVTSVILWSGQKFKMQGGQDLLSYLPWRRGFYIHL